MTWSAGGLGNEAKADGPIMSVADEYLAMLLRTSKTGKIKHLFTAIPPGVFSDSFDIIFLN